MTYETAQYAADWLYNNYLLNDKRWAPAINYFGGEPMMCWDTIIKPLTAYIREKYGEVYNLSITTNGVLLDEDRLKFLRDSNVSMLLSMDGSQYTQDMQRPLKCGGSSYNILAPKLEIIRTYYPNIGFRSTITADSAHLVYENFMYAVNNGFVSWFGMPNDFEVWDEQHLEVLRAEVRKFGDYFVNECRSARRPVPFSSFEKMFGTINLINAAIQKGVDRNIPRCAACSRCGLGGTHYAAIDPTGRVFTCQDMSSFENEASPFYLGNIFTGIDNSRRELMVADYDTRRCSGNDCEKCRMNRVCDGGCVANNYMKSGDIKSVSIVHCEWYQMLLEEAIRVMGILGAEHNETFKQIWSVYNG